jgi:hypothetical protein
LRDSIECEWAGIPSVAIVHEALEPAAQAMAEVSGMAGYPWITVHYPHHSTGGWTEEETVQLARELAPSVLARLTEPDAQ